MKTKRFYKVLLVSLVVLLLMTTLVVNAKKSPPSTQIHLHVKDVSSVEAYIVGDPASTVLGVTGWYTLTQYGNTWKMFDGKLEHLPMLIEFRVDGKIYIVNPPNNRSPYLRVGQEGLGTGTNNYWLKIPEPIESPIPH